MKKLKSKWLFFTAITLFWSVVAIIVIGQMRSLGPYNFLDYTISKQVGWSVWSAMLFGVSNTICFILAWAFLSRNLFSWDISKPWKVTMKIALILFLLISYIPYNVEHGTDLPHRLLAYLMIIIIVSYVIAMLIEFKISKVGLAVTSIMFLPAAIALVLFIRSIILQTGMVYDYVFITESLGIIGFFAFMPFMTDEKREKSILTRLRLAPALIKINAKSE